MTSKAFVKIKNKRLIAKKKIFSFTISMASAKTRYFLFLFHSLLKKKNNNSNIIFYKWLLWIFVVAGRAYNRAAYTKFLYLYSFTDNTVWFSFSFCYTFVCLLYIGMTLVVIIIYFSFLIFCCCSSYSPTPLPRLPSPTSSTCTRIFHSVHNENKQKTKSHSQ